ncbi:MAG: hypothetical protein ACI8UO_006787, partial [Verrucomicrobiales bacterium]
MDRGVAKFVRISADRSHWDGARFQVEFRFANATPNCQLSS